MITILHIGGWKKCCRHALVFFVFALPLTYIFGSDTLDQSEKVFVSELQKAFSSRNISDFLELYCFDGVEPGVRKKTERQIVPELLKSRFVSASFRPLFSSMGSSYTVQGTTYTPNLKPYKTLTILLQKPNSTEKTTIAFLIGTKNDELSISLFVLKPQARAEQGAAANP